MKVDTWIVELDSLPAERYAGLLSNDERVRASRFRFERDCHRFTVARGMLRTLLGQILACDPAGLRLSYTQKGKPVLADHPVRFNLSHSGGYAAFAFAVEGDLGIDLEQISRMPLEEQIAERFFSPAEVAVLRSLPVEIQPLAFFNCWTRKEAYIKALGEGLSVSLDRFDVSLAPGEPARLLRVLDRPDDIYRWSLSELRTPSGFAGALCAEGGNLEVVYR